jgi:ferredoxin
MADEVKQIRVVVDRAACESHAACMGLVPEVFDIDDDDVMHILVEHPSVDLLPELRKAVIACPRAALRLELS